MRHTTIPVSFLTRLFICSLPNAAASEVSSILEQRISGSNAETATAETGRVLSIGDGIARCACLSSMDVSSVFSAY